MPAGPLLSLSLSPLSLVSSSLPRSCRCPPVTPHSPLNATAVAALAVSALRFGPVPRSPEAASRRLAFSAPLLLSRRGASGVGGSHSERAAAAGGPPAATEMGDGEAAAVGIGEPGKKRFEPRISWEPEVEAFLRASYGDRLSSITDALARPPLSTCLRVNTTRTTQAAVLASLKGELSDVDRAVLGDRTPCAHASVPDVVVVPGQGPNTIDYSEEGLKEVVVTRKAGEAILRGAHAFVPGVLAASHGLNEGDRVAVSIALELPGKETFAMTRGTVLGSDHEALRDAERGAERAALTIGIGEARLGRKAMFNEKKGVGVEMVDRVFRIPSCAGVLRGDVMLQNLPSTVAAAVLAPKPGSRVLDMCAAPGGKTTALAAMMRDEGELIALDRSHSKAADVAGLAREMGLRCVSAHKMDSTRALARPSKRGATDGPEDRGEKPRIVPSEKELARKRRREAAMRARGIDPDELAAGGKAKGKNQEPMKPPVDPFAPESFDFIMLDGPCSALGLRPRLLHRQRMRELLSTAGYQRAFIDNAVGLLKPGGEMVYSTCTISPAENEANVRYLLDKYPQMELVPQAPYVGEPGAVGSVQAGDTTLTLLTESEAALVQRFLPDGPLDTIGFFISKFRKKQ